MSKLIWIILKTKNSLTSTSAIWRRRQWNPTPVLLPGKSHGWRSLEGCSPWDRWGSDTTEQLHFHFSLSCIGEGNGNPLQCSCLENPRDGEPGGLPSMGSHRVGHDWSDLAAVLFKPACTFCLEDFALSYVSLLLYLYMQFSKCLNFNILKPFSSYSKQPKLLSWSYISLQLSPFFS